LSTTDQTTVSSSASAKPLQTYLALDLAHDGAIAKDLFARIDREAQRSTMKLTGDGDRGAPSPNLTPEMLAWVGAHIGSRRQTALAAIEAAARQIRGEGNTEGIVAEIESDRLKRDRTERESEETHAFYERRKDQIDKLNRLEGEYNAQREDLGDRDAIVPPLLVEWGLPMLVAVPEGFMNYGSFVSLAGLGIAGLGLTIVAGVAIGVSAWLAGRFWKAWHFYMRADDDDQQKRGLRMIGLATVLLVVALGFVGYARYKTVAEKALEMAVLGLPPPNPALQTALLLTGNLLVFFIGAAITYILHDEDPLFAERAAKLARQRAGFESARARELDRKVAEIKRGHRQKHDAMMKRAERMRRSKDYDAVAEDMGRLTAKDQEVVGLLQSYRGQLVNEIEKRGGTCSFSPTTQERQTGNSTNTIDLDDFAALELHLYRGIR
jgi:hypothetical protein